MLPVPSLRGQCARNVHEGVGESGELTKAVRPGRRARRRLTKRGGQRLASLIEVAERDRLGASVVGEGARGLPDEAERVLDAGERVGIEERTVDRARAGMAEDEQMTGQVPAVHGGDVPGLERAQVARVIPVVEVAPEPLEAPQRLEGRLEPSERLEAAEPAEVARGGRRQQIEPDIRGRRAMRDDGLRILLEVIRRQVMVGGTHEGLEEAPRAARRGAEGSGVRGRQQWCRRQASWPAHPPGNQRREAPQQQERRGDHGAVRPRQGDQRPTHDDEDRRAAHAPIHAGDLAGHVRLGLRRRRPLEQAPVGQIQAAERAPDRVGHQPRLMREERDAEPDLSAGDGEALPDGAHVSPLGDPRAPGDQVGERGQQGGQGDGDEHEGRPHERPAVGQCPAGDEGQPGGGSRQCPPEIVEHLPPADERDPGRAPRVGRGSPDDPGEQLPISARPPVLPGNGNLVVRRELLEQLDVRDESGPGEDPLDEIVAQERVLRHAAGQGRGERVHVIDPFAGIRAFAEEILVHVGDRGGIWIDPGRPGEDPLEERQVAIRGHRGRDPRLKHAVSVHDAAHARVERRPVEGMGHGADQTVDGASGQMRVGVEGDHVADGGGHVGPPGEERRVVPPAQEMVQLVELPALALPTHPLAFRLIPDTSPMQYEEALTGVGSTTVAAVEARHPVDRCREEPIIFRHGLGGRVAPVGQEGEVNVTVRIGEVVDFQAIDMLLDLGLVGQKGGHHDERSRARRDTVAQFQARQGPRAQQIRDGTVDERDREVRGRDEGDKT